MRDRRTFFAILIIVAMGNTGCSRPSAPQDAPQAETAPANNTETRIADSLTQLLKCTTDERDCFVIIEERQSKQVLQFVGSADEALMLDLPFAGLSPEQRSLAATLSFDGHKFVAADHSFQLACGRDVTLGTTAALAVVREVYRLGDDAELDVTLH